MCVSRIALSERGGAGPAAWGPKRFLSRWSTESPREVRSLVVVAPGLEESPSPIPTPTPELGALTD